MVMLLMQSSIVSSTHWWGISQSWDLYDLGHLRYMSVHVPQRRVNESLHRVNSAAVRAPQCTTVSRQAHTVPVPYLLWHIGLHCFIRWKFVIHGEIVGFSLHTTTHLRLLHMKAVNKNVPGHPKYVLIEGERMLVLLLLWWLSGVL